MSVKLEGAVPRRRILAAAAVAAWLAAGIPVPATTQDSAPASAPAAKPAAPVQKKTSSAKKPAAKKSPAAKDAAKQAAAGTCEPSRTFVPVEKSPGVCAPGAESPAGQKFNTLEDIYVPPPAGGDQKPQ